MKKKFLAILKALGFEVVRYEHWKNNFDWNNYEIEYKNKEGETFLWDGETDIWDKNETSISNSTGILEYFRKCAEANCATTLEYKFYVSKEDMKYFEFRGYDKNDIIEIFDDVLTVEIIKLLYEK